MKVLVLDSPVKTINELELLKGRKIQGLYSARDCSESYWALKAKIELAVFQIEKGEKPE
jgi:hypothetical protein